MKKETNERLVGLDKINFSKKTFQRNKNKKNNSKINEALNTTNILTAILIFVTLASIGATIKITNVSLYLEEARQRDALITELDYTQKIISELNENKAKLEFIYNEINNGKYREGDSYYSNEIRISTLENTNEMLKLDDELIEEIGLYLSEFKILKGHIEDMKI